MPKLNGVERLVRVKKQWRFTAAITNLLLALTFTLPVYIIAERLWSAGVFFGLASLLVLFAVVSWLNQNWRLNEVDVSRWLNATQPSLEESAQLVLQPKEAMSLLERLQVEKVESELQQLPIGYPFKKQLRLACLLFGLGLVAAFVSSKWPLSPSPKQAGKAVVNSKAPAEIVLPAIEKTTVIITPAAYTGKPQREQSRFNLLAEEGAVVSWKIQTTVAAKKVILLFNDGSRLDLSGDDSHLNWRLQKQIQTSGFYQVKIDDQLSELYQIEAIRDQKPVITVQAPKPSTTISYGQPESVMLTVGINDDYGISNAAISATVSSGQGEAVKFKEQRLSFPDFVAGGRTYRLQKLIDCKALGMQPGEELYFFVSTLDNRQQESRSDVFIVTLEDTTGLFSMEGMATALDIKPELFRSQRQIIIETEQLLKERASLGEEAFKKKSNDLGTDQKLLRLRYGKFLGEETDTEIGGDHDHEEGDHSDGGETDILDQYSHKHDNAEDATFFDAATKKQLKETLNEMWKAELQLRTLKPKEALPFEYKALRLLKDLQQKSRVYVAKTGVKTTPLKLDKRLSGDLSAVNEPVAQRNFPDAGKAEATRVALGLLEELKYTGQVSAPGREALQSAFRELSSKAAHQPAQYLGALSALKKIITEDYRVRDIEKAQAGLQKMTAAPEKLPYAVSGTLSDLEKQYFINLKKSNRQR